MRHTEIDFDAFNGSSANDYNGKFNLQLADGITYKEITIHGVGLNKDQLRRVTLSLNETGFIGKHIKLSLRNCCAHETEIHTDSGNFLVTMLTRRQHLPRGIRNNYPGNIQRNHIE